MIVNVFALWVVVGRNRFRGVVSGSGNQGFWIVLISSFKIRWIRSEIEIILNWYFQSSESKILFLYWEWKFHPRSPTRWCFQQLLCEGGEGPDFMSHLCQMAQNPRQDKPKCNIWGKHLLKKQTKWCQNSVPGLGVGAMWQRSEVICSSSSSRTRCHDLGGGESDTIEKTQSTC